MLKFPAYFEPASEGGFVVTFQDVPEAITQGDSLEEARTAAGDALVTALEFYFADQRPVPVIAEAPAAAEGVEWIALPASISAKVLLLNELVQQGVRPAELARRLNTSRQEVTRILDLRHNTKIDTIAAAVAAVGRKLDIRVV